ncbi:LysR family transcriptional regulator [Pseudomonas sp. NFX15]|uniref:LysR family transcriptional regulator n=1 Tax=Pseudomonas sp. NFX15 TaxID=2816958 RepID=UPI003B8B99B7
MKRNDLRSIDLNLLVVFEALIQERNVTRAAQRLCLGQPAVSGALGRLRALFNDPLFNRIGHKMEPTTRALQVAQTLGPVLDAICTVVSSDDLREKT